MTIQSALKQGQSILFYAEVDTPMLDSTVLLAEVLGITRETLFASLTNHIDEKAFHTFKELIDKRCKGIPVSYIRHKKEFYGLEFYVDERVLVPRPDTEILVDVVLSILEYYPDITTLHDACTGSGCIAISLKFEKPGLFISASDISGEAGEIFSINVKNLLDSVIPFYRSNLLRDINGKFDIIMANPPYLSGKEVEDMKKIGWPEPESALRGGRDGIALSELLIHEASMKINPGGFLVMESSPAHMSVLHRIMTTCGFTGISIVKDLGARDRVITGRMPWKR
ncbi:MAG: peptide chain release factor N(5)-glutamine methyltransferase [Spirochaetales bacterium]|nr:peptide chain release factor N(5)-glutamine methyltransferase [Spirochaetales bacterium]